MSDDFFDDEQELMSEEAAAAEKAPADDSKKVKAARKDAKAKKQAVPESADVTPVRQGPPFWMVLAIAAIALILGVVIGYLLGTQATLAELSSASAAATTSTTSSSSTDPSGVLPEGHPNLKINEDGTATLADSGSAAE